MNKKNTQRGLFYSVISLLLCVSMLVGTTLAWFSDSVSSTGNIIKTGRLDVTMEYANDPNGEWKDASEATIFSGNLWEPGYSDMKFIKVSNTGNLAFNYQMHILPAVRATGEVDLADVIDVYVGVVEEGFEVPAAFSAEMAGLSRQGTLAEVMAAEPATGILLPVGADGSNLSGADVGEVTYCVLLHMQETAGNEYQNLTVGNNFTIQLVATQMGYEQDTFGSNYDADADYTATKNPDVIYDEEVSKTVVVTAEQELVEEVKLESGLVAAEVPAGVKLAEGAEALTLTVETMETSEANVTLSGDEVAKSVDVHVEGVAEDNTVPVLVTLEHVLPAGLYSSNLALYHVENGETVAMTQVALEEVDAHNEYYYDVETGNVVMALASFSEIVTVANTANPWDGTVAEAFAGGDGSEGNPYQIYNEAQFAYFRDQVDDGNNYKGKFIALKDDIDLNNINFDPIGWGYENTEYNAGDAEGKPFKGTFDGQGHTISNLYQSGWDLEADNGTDYTYTNCGFGLFAAACDATFKNLTISDAYIRTECVEMGVLVGLSQGNCTYTNINIQNSKIANYQRPTGGLIGEVSGNGTTQITDVNIDDDVVVGSLWGDFDAPVGGVVGARWADGMDPQIYMTNVSVECKLDVYSDVTSSYQWYAYRRAGMLIGNTETSTPNENGTNIATAEFLHCDGVTVEYGGWVDYHYCEFNNHEPRWPFVRVEAGENCEAFSNPRWGVPNDVNGKKVTDMNHKHQDGDKCGLHIPFGQLYGGGQGVYGQAKHDGVEIINYKYKVEFINKGEVLFTYYAATNDGVYTLPTDPNGEAVKKALDSIKDEIPEGINISFSHWMNAGSTIVEKIPADNINNYKVYPSFENLYTATFVDQQGNVLGYEFFTKDTASKVTTKANSITPPTIEDCIFDHWDVHVTDADGKTTVSKAWSEYLKDKTLGTTDISLYPIYTYDGDVNLIPVDSDGDGITNYYQVGGYGKPEGQDLVVIPDEVNGIKVTEINANAFSSYDGVHSVVIPKTIGSTGANILAKKNSDETVTIYFMGTYDEWKQVEAKFNSEWESGVSTSSRIFFLDENGKVIPGTYLQRKWGLFSGYSWGEKQITDEIVEEYTGKCDCSSCRKVNADRPDKEYWVGVTFN